MENFKISLSLVNGSAEFFNNELNTGSDIIRAFFGDDTRPPITHLILDATCDDGRKVHISIANTASKRVHVAIQDKNSKPA